MINERKKDIDICLASVKDYIKENNLISAKSSLLEELRKKVNIDKSKRNFTDSDQYLAHYTSVDTIYSILEHQTIDLKTGCLRLYDAFYFNDPNEGRYLKNELEKSYEWMKNATQETQDTDAFICSFVHGNKKIGDNLSYWQSYGKDGLGCSIQLSAGYKYKQDFKPVLYGKKNIEKMKKRYRDYFDLGSILYHKFQANNDKESFATEFWKCFDGIKFLYKDDAYANENEYRFVIVSSKESEIEYDFRSEGPYLRKYILNKKLQVDKILTSGSKIVIGPTVRKAKHLSKNLEKLARRKSLYGPIFTSSQIPYQKFW